MRFLKVSTAAAILLVAAACQSSEAPQPATQANPTNQSPGEPCDRECLEGFVDQYLDAMAAGDPSMVPLTDDFRMTENGQQLPLGDALWKTMVGRGTYRLFTTDVEAGQVVFLGTIREEANGNPAGALSAIALRLKVEDQRISEAESIVLRGGGGNLGNAAVNLEELGTPDPIYLAEVPEDERMSREELIRVSNMYFSGMEKNDGQMDYPFAEDCDRLENGNPTTNVPTEPGETRPDPATARMYSAEWTCMEQFESGLIHFVWRIRDRRFVAVDRERGLAFAFAFFDHALGEDRTFEAPDGREITSGPIDPWTWEIAELFKVENGLIRRIEALLIRSPYGMGSGWSDFEGVMSSEVRDVTRE